MTDTNDAYVVEPNDTTTGYVDPDVKDCPVIPLGFVGRDIVFALPEGEIRREPSARISAMLATDVYASIAGTAFLTNWKSPDDGKIQLQPAARWLVRKCRDRGIYDGDRPQRGYGVWPTADGPVVHVGNAVGRWPFKDDGWRQVSEMLREDVSGPIWLLRPPTPRPKKAASIADVQTLRSTLDRWNFAPLDPGGPSGGLSEADVVFGHLGVVLLGAWPRFRPHINVSGGAGTGKTTLSRLMQAAASANAGELLDSFTDAGIRNSLSGEARGLYLDEAEPSTDGQPGPVEKAMEVLRRMSTGEGSAGRKGSINGGVAATSAVGSAYLASIYPIALGDAMSSRMVEVRLRPLGKAKGGADEDLEEAIVKARDLSPALLARALREAARFRADVSMLKSALGEGGQAPRAADLIASLAAGRRLLLFDEALTAETARDEVALWAALAKGREESSSAQNPGQACLSKIWAINSGQHSHDRHLSLGELITEELEAPSAREKVLKAWGLKVENGHAGAERVGPWLVISNNHPSLSRALAGTSFANWRGVLEHLADLGPTYTPQHPSGPVRFGMHQSRAMAIPLAPWLERPVVIGADRNAVTPFEPPNWHRDAPVSHDPSHAASHGETYE